MKGKLTRVQKKTLKDMKRMYPMTTDEAYPPNTDQIDQPVIHADINKPVKIEYYAHGKVLSVFLIHKGSNQMEREQLAQEMGIQFFDRFVLDDGRVDAKVTDQKGFTDEYGRLWIVENKL